MKLQLVLILGLICGVFADANAAVNVKNDTENAYNQKMQEANSITIEEARTIQTLENDIRILDAEIAKCEKSKKGWTAATVIGSAGVAATGIAAIVQGVQISKKKDQLSSVKQETKTLKDENEKAAKK